LAQTLILRLAFFFLTVMDICHNVFFRSAGNFYLGDAGLFNPHLWGLFEVHGELFLKELFRLFETEVIMESLQDSYEEAREFHGGLCGGIVLGVRMARLGCRMIGLEEPRKPENRKKIMVCVEISRCATDGIQSVTGCSLGRRTLKLMDYGVMAATFLNLETKKAVRISIHQDSRQKAKTQFPHLTDENHVYLEAYKLMSDEDLFKAEEVRVHLSELDLPGPPLKRLKCDLCGEEVLQGRGIEHEGKIACRRCACLPLYYSPVENPNGDNGRTESRDPKST
jgi:formylmethanofuran dehydrogenase subunit E